MTFEQVIKREILLIKWILPNFDEVEFHALTTEKMCVRCFNTYLIVKILSKNFWLVLTTYYLDTCIRWLTETPRLEAKEELLCDQNNRSKHPRS